MHARSAAPSRTRPRCSGAVAGRGSRPAATRRRERADQSARASSASTSSASGMPSSTANCSGRLWVWSKNATGRSGKRRQRPGEIEFAEADAEPRMRGDQRQRVRPDAEARARDVALGAKRVSPPKHVLARVRPRPRSPHQSAQIDSGARTRSSGPGATGAGRAGPSAASVSMPSARCARRSARRRRRTAPPGAATRRASVTRLAEPDRGDDRPQQQAAQVVRLAQVADGAAGM